LFVTCLADLFRPAVGFASLELLEKAGYDVSVPVAQTCCGQPAYNSGDYKAARSLAMQVIDLLEPADYVVVPSGSCAGMLSHHYPRLLEGDWHDRALALAAKTFELTTFLHEIARLSATQRGRSSPGDAAIAYHDSCAGLRELDIRDQPRTLLHAMCNIQPLELPQRDVCCGFGGTFCAKMPGISAKMADDKLDQAVATGADTLVGGDLGCLLHLAGRAKRRGLNLKLRHVAEILVQDSTSPAIGEKS
ncbi:MAG: (Fe-S)-binding protein, partial [Halioglobus sp.]|nr:(Fe-S)-binding protein [Halioglobus sp.]